MPKVKVADLEIEMSVDELIDFLKKTQPSEIVAKLKALQEAKKTE